jgi:hypothetical protein
MGSYGAVAEFFQDPGEAIESDDALARVTARGGIRIEIPRDLGVFAYENPGAHGDSSQHIALCLPADSSQMSCNSVLAELGPDEEALRPDDRESALVDLGVSALGGGCFQLDFCIRTEDPDFAHFLRQHVGCNIFEHASPVFGKLLEVQPHRVILTRLGRLEVFQAIGGEHTEGRTPEGPHTHLLPELLARNRTHPEAVPIAEGWVPCAFLYPEKAVI